MSYLDPPDEPASGGWQPPPTPGPGFDPASDPTQVAPTSAGAPSLPPAATPPPAGPPPGGYSAPGAHPPPAAPQPSYPPQPGYPPAGYPPAGYPPGAYGSAYPPPGGGYAPMGYGGVYQTQVDHPRGVLVLVFGILSLVMWCPCGVLGPVAWIMGRNALKEIDANPGYYKNRGMVQAGWILGMITTILIVLGILFFVAIAIADSGSSSGY